MPALWDSLTGLLYASSGILLLARRRRVAGALLALLGSGSLGALWADYSRRSGSHLRISCLRHRCAPVRHEWLFLATHLPALPVGLWLLGGVRRA